MTVFFDDDDYRLYLDILAERCRKSGVEVWAYCLMPNHAHLILVPASPAGSCIPVKKDDAVSRVAHGRVSRTLHRRDAIWTKKAPLSGTLLFQTGFASSSSQ